MVTGSRIAAWQAWSAQPARNRIWRTREGRVRSSRRRKPTGEGAASATRACGRLPLMVEAWPWQEGASWATWRGIRIDSLMTTELLRPVLWGCWTRTLDALGVEHGGVGVVTVEMIRRTSRIRASFTAALARLDHVGSAGDTGAQGVIICRLVLELATLQGEEAARQSLGAGVSLSGEAAQRIIKDVVSAEHSILQHDLGRCHLLGDVKGVSH